jgi:hypothetical protein
MPTPPQLSRLSGIALLLRGSREGQSGARVSCMLDLGLIQLEVLLEVRQGTSPYFALILCKDNKIFELARDARCNGSNDTGQTY